MDKTEIKLKRVMEYLALMTGEAGYTGPTARYWAHETLEALRLIDEGNCCGHASDCERHNNAYECGTECSCNVLELKKAATEKAF